MGSTERSTKELENLAQSHASLLKTLSTLRRPRARSNDSRLSSWRDEHRATGYATSHHVEERPAADASHASHFRLAREQPMSDRSANQVTKSRRPGAQCHVHSPTLRQVLYDFIA